MNKEECMKALENLKCRQTVDKISGEYRHCYMMINNYAETTECFERLINEHFDNPPLKFEELHENLWVWDNYEKRYKHFLHSNKYKDLIFSDFFTNDICGFEENRFFLHEVKE